MDATAKLSFLRIAPRKVGLLASEIRGRGVNEAIGYLRFSPRKRTASILAKLLKSAVANADGKGVKDVDRLVVKSVVVGQGPTLKRFRARAKGSAFRINKKTSHIFMTVGER